MLFYRRWRWVLCAAVAGALAIAVLLHRGPNRVEGAPAAHAAGSSMTAEHALEELRAGNARYAASRRTLSTDTAHDAELRKELVQGQHPFAAMLCCADSRICPEFIFDQHAGSIFEIRNAGNVADEDVMASLEYAVEHLHVPVILVLGHKGCGAIAAVHEAGGKPLHDHLRALQEHMQGIRGEMLATRNDHTAALLDHLSEENARQQAMLLVRESAPIKQAVQKGETHLYFGLYDMLTGAVDLHELQ